MYVSISTPERSPFDTAILDHVGQSGSRRSLSGATPPSRRPSSSAIMALVRLVGGLTLEITAARARRLALWGMWRAMRLLNPKGVLRMFEGQTRKVSGTEGRADRSKAKQEPT